MKAASHHSTRSRRPHRHCPFATRTASSKRVTVQGLDGYTLSLSPPACKPPEHSVHMLAHGIALFWSAEWGIRGAEWVADIRLGERREGQVARGKRSRVTDAGTQISGVREDAILRNEGDNILDSSTSESRARFSIDKLLIFL
jgi:hypothetical protein